MISEKWAEPPEKRILAAARKGDSLTLRRLLEHSKELKVPRAGLRGGVGVGMGVSGMVSVGLVLSCIEAKFCK